MSPSARPALSALGVVAASLLLGGVTSWAQGWLPKTFASFANSPSGWTLLTALLVVAVRPSPRWGAVLGVLSFVSLVLGYAVASQIRGLTYDPVVWSVVGILAGPFVGAAASAMTGRHTIRAGSGAGALAGVFLADGIYGLTVISTTTSHVYWIVCLALGVAILVAMTAWLRDVVGVGAMLVTTGMATGILSAGYALLNGLRL